MPLLFPLAWSRALISPFIARAACRLFHDLAGAAQLVVEKMFWFFPVVIMIDDYGEKVGPVNHIGCEFE